MYNSVINIETTETIMTYQVVLKLENATTAAGFAARAVVLHNPNDQFCVKDIMESANVDTLRDAVKQNAPDVTHYAASNGHYVAGGWSEALKEAKKMAYDMAQADHAVVRPNMSWRHLVETHEAHLVAVEVAAERAADERAEQEQRAAMREALKEERADFDAWEQVARKDDALRPLWTTMRDARQSVRDWPATLEKHVEKLTANPTYALGWSGDFVEAAAKYEVSQSLVEHFEAGVEPADMLDMVTQHMLQNAERATSRSTSVMSNLTDDATRAAWTSAFKRLSGRSFW